MSFMVHDNRTLVSKFLEYVEPPDFCNIKLVSKYFSDSVQVLNPYSYLEIPIIPVPNLIKERFDNKNTYTRYRFRVIHEEGKYWIWIGGLHYLKVAKLEGIFSRKKSIIRIDPTGNMIVTVDRKIQFWTTDFDLINKFYIGGSESVGNHCDVIFNLKYGWVIVKYDRVGCRSMVSELREYTIHKNYGWSVCGEPWWEIRPRYKLIDYMNNDPTGECDWFAVSNNTLHTICLMKMDLVEKEGIKIYKHKVWKMLKRPDNTTFIKVGPGGKWMLTGSGVNMHGAYKAGFDIYDSSLQLVKRYKPTANPLYTKINNQAIDPDDQVYTQRIIKNIKSIEMLNDYTIVIVFDKGFYGYFDISDIENGNIKQLLLDRNVAGIYKINGKDPFGRWELRLETDPNRKDDFYRVYNVYM